MTESGRTYREEIRATAAALGELAHQEEVRAQATEQAKERQEFFNQIQQDFQQGILDAILEGENLVDVLGSIAKAFARAALEAALFGSGPFGGGGSGLLGGIFNTVFGGLFGGGATVPNAKGNVVYQSALIPMAKGGRALIGEAGPEAIMPLDRTPDGTLGVRALGGGMGGGMAINYQPTFNIYPNGQVDKSGDDGGGGAYAKLLETLDSEVHAKVIEVLNRELQNGGLFNPAAKPYG